MLKITNTIQLLIAALLTYAFITVCTAKVYIASVNSGCAAGSWELILCTPAALYYMYLTIKNFKENNNHNGVMRLSALILILVLVDGILIFFDLTNSSWSKNASTVSSMGMKVEATATEEFKQLLIVSAVLFGFSFFSHYLYNKQQKASKV